jgi:thioredoxin-related protein
MYLSISMTAQETIANYFTESDKAISYAKANDAEILMVFGGSDWCRPCIQFKKEILDATDFKKKTAGNVAVLYLDFPSKKKNRLSKEATQHNEALAAKYNTSGSFPKIILMDKGMKKIREISYEGQSSADFITLL